MPKYYLNWSSGKDAAMALYYCRFQLQIPVDLLLTTVNKDYDRVSMHGLRKELLNKQLESIRIAHLSIPIPKDVNMSAYNAIMKSAVRNLCSQGYTHSIFGDIFLEDLRKYREEQLNTEGIQGVFPLWKKDTKELLLTFLNLGFKAITVCVDANKLDASFVGREINEAFLKDLPPDVDPCGENGEFHTFVYDGPIFKHPVSFTIGEKIKRSYTIKKEKDHCFNKEEAPKWNNVFWYVDLY